MILNLREFVEFPAEALVHAGSGEISAPDDRVVAIGAVVARVAVQKSAQEYFCQGRVTAQVTLECARCLAPFLAELSEDTDFVICSSGLAGERGRLDQEDYLLLQGNDLTVDIVEPVRQALTLAVPLKPLCREDCRGLCPQCGANLNEGLCGCRTETTDPRWDGLRRLFPDK